MPDYTPVSPERIAAEYARRRVNRSAQVQACERIAKVYGNDIALPMPELAAADAAPVANLIATGIDQHAQRIADLLPDIQCPPVKEGNDRSIQRAAKRRRACYGYWDRNEYELLMPKRARYLVAYATSPVRVRPDQKMQGPKWEVLSPLSTFPCEEGVTVPDDTITAATRDVAWLRYYYPDLPLNTVSVHMGRRQNPRDLANDDLVEVIQWLDGNETVTIATGVGYALNLEHEAEYGIGDATITNLSSGFDENSMWAVTLKRTPNRTGLPPVITPGRISLLDIAKGQFDDTIDLYRMQAVLASMEVNAIANSIWPDLYLVPSGPGEQPQVLTEANGRLGVMGRIQGGTIVPIQTQAGMQTPQAIDRLERAIRLQGQVPADFSGESPSNVRTARRGAAVLSEAVDYTLAEHQKILARSMQHELEVAAAIDETYFGRAEKSFFVNWHGAKGRLDYTPADIWGEDRTIHVGFAKVGADREQIKVENGQMVGMGVMSKDTAMRRDPDIEDPDKEKALIIGEGLDAALLASLQQQANAGSLPAVDLASIKVKTTGGDSLEAAVIAQQAEAQQRQAEQVAAQAPEAQPGLALPGQGVEGQPSIPEPTPSAQNLADLLRAVRTPAVAAGG